ncbi:hypothetical protein HOLleu_36854 [Holothuria leucospilota]|uniref:Uncharacterized protein n=1 Tax=Holothuria leucospilota TaxID=206669 RepID=A0A9Q0YKG0_HOLLE|nr:hypothetical protein HOLleu_36854 [Holothuria leucospilota]
MIFVYNYLKGPLKTNHCLLTLSEGTTTIGHSLKLVKPRVDTSLRQIFFMQRSIDSWSSLPEHVFSAPSTVSTLLF